MLKLLKQRIVMKKGKALGQKYVLRILKLRKQKSRLTKNQVRLRALAQLYMVFLHKLRSSHRRKAAYRKTEARD